MADHIKLDLYIAFFDEIKQIQAIILSALYKKFRIF